MSWKNGDYFGSSGLQPEEQKIPVVTVTSPFKNDTTFVFKDAASYQNFIAWATMSLLEEGYTFSVHKVKINEAPTVIKTDFYKKMMSDFYSYRDGYDYFE